MQKQVSREHYDFRTYMHKKRWISYWHQIDEVLRFGPSSILEIGPGPGLFKTIAGGFGIPVETVDIDPDLCPDYVASVFDLPFADQAYDVVCAFQMLEHLPYEKSLLAFAQMARVAKRGIVISLPDARGAWPLLIGLPFGRELSSLVPSPRFWARPHTFDGEHYWELNKKGYRLPDVTADLSSYGFALERSYRVELFPYHRFLVFRRESAAAAARAGND